MCDTVTVTFSDITQSARVGIVLMRGESLGCGGGSTKGTKIIAICYQTVCPLSWAQYVY